MLRFALMLALLYLAIAEENACRISSGEEDMIVEKLFAQLEEAQKDSKIEQTALEALFLGGYLEYCAQLKIGLRNDATFNSIVQKIARQQTGLLEELDTGKSIVEYAAGLKLVQSSSGTVQIGVSNTARRVAAYLAKNPQAKIQLTRMLTRSGMRGLRIIKSIMPAYLKQHIQPLLQQFPVMMKTFDVPGALQKIDVLLTAGYLSYEAIQNIRRWWNGDISASRASKNVIDASASLLGGAGGCSAGAAVGGTVGPVGATVGCAIGSVLGSIGASTLSDQLTLAIFDLDPAEALENAYRFMGVSRHADNDEINKKYRKMSLSLHPDKPGGSQIEFMKLNTNLEVIRAARQG